MNRRTLTVDIDGEERTVEYRDTSSFRFIVNGKTEDTGDDYVTSHTVRSVTVKEATGSERIRNARDIKKEHIQAAIDHSLEKVDWIEVTGVEVEERRTKRMWSGLLDDQQGPVEVEQ